MAHKNRLGVLERITGWFSIFLLLVSLFPIVESQNIIRHPFELLVFAAGYFFFEHFNAKNILVVASLLVVAAIYPDGTLSFYLALSMVFYLAMYLIDVIINHQVHFRLSLVLIAAALIYATYTTIDSFTIDLLSAVIVVFGFILVSFLEWRTFKHPKKISIIIPTYNRAKTIKTTLNSIKEQVYQNYEVIIVDDGSTDNTRRIVEKYLKNNPEINGRYFYQDNQDQLNAIKNATKYLTGDAVLILHSDDALYNKYVLRNGYRALNNGDCDGVFIDLVEFDNHDKRLKKIYTKPYYQSWSAMVKVSLGFGRNPYTDTAFWHRDVFESVVTNSYLINNQIAWYDFQNHRQLNMKNGNFFGIKYRIHPGNYMNSADGSINVLSGELRTFLGLIAHQKIPFFMVQSFWYRALNKLKLSSLMAAIATIGPTNPKNILEFVISHRQKKTTNPYLKAIIGFFKHDSKKTEQIVIPRNLRIYHGADIRMFNRDLKSHELSEFYLDLMNSLAHGVKKFTVLDEDLEKLRQILAFFCVQDFVQINGEKVTASENSWQFGAFLKKPIIERVESVLSLLLTVFAIIFAVVDVDPLLKTGLALILACIFPLNLNFLHRHFNSKNIVVTLLSLTNAWLLNEPLLYLAILLASTIFCVNYGLQVVSQKSRNFRWPIVTMEFLMVVGSVILLMESAAKQPIFTTSFNWIFFAVMILTDIYFVIAIYRIVKPSGKLSIIIPTYNGGETIKETLDSIKNQTYRDIEVVVVDDQSTDNTKEIVEKYQSRHHKLKVKYYRQKNADQLNAIKNGLKHISGNYIYILHSDDIFYNRHVVENGLSQLQDAEVDGVFVDLEQISGAGKKIKNIYTQPFYQSQTNLAKVMLNFGRNPYVDFAFWQRSVFENVVYQSYLTNNMVAWFDFKKFEFLRMENGNFFGIKYRVHEGNYLNSADGTVNVLSGELRIVSHLSAKISTPQYKLQSVFYRGMHKLKLGSLAPIINTAGQKTAKEAIASTIKTRMDAKDSIYIASIAKFFDNEKPRSIEDVLPNDLKIYDGGDIRLFNRDLKNSNLPEFYDAFMHEMRIGFDKIVVDANDFSNWQRILEFFCIKDYVKIEVKK